MQEQAAVPPQLPVWRTIVEGYWWAIWHLRTYVAMALVWAIVTAVLQLLLGDLPRLLADIPADASPIVAAGQYAPSLAISAATFLGAAVIAVAAYRLVILDEPTDWKRSLRIGRRELRVLGLSILIYVVAIAEILVLTVVLHLIGALDATDSMQADRLPVLIITAMLWSLLVAVTLTPFVGFVFPLAAIDAPSGLFRRSLRTSCGYRLRLACIAFVADLPWVLAYHIPGILWGQSPGETPEGLHIGLSTFITLLSTAFGSMVLGKAFATIADRQHEGIYGVFD